MPVRAKKESIKRSGRWKKTIVTRMISRALPKSLGSSLPQPGEAHAQDDNVEAKSKEARLYRQGLSYRTMSADNRVCHDSDIRQLPAGAKIIRRFRKYAYEQISRLVDMITRSSVTRHRRGKSMKAISLSTSILQSLTLFRERTLPVLFRLIFLSTNMFRTLRFIVRCTDYPVSRCV